MPVMTSSRSPASYVTLSSTSTPSRSHVPRTISPPSTSGYSNTITSVGQVVKMNVVTRVAIEGKAKQGQDGVYIKMYMKLSIPVDSVTPGSTIALFPEENVKILTSQVHPLDNNSAPYNFSSAASPLLHNAARALNLPARLPTTFNASSSHLGSTVHASASTASTSHLDDPADSIPPVDVFYTGQILVSGYHIAYVLPKSFPSQNQSESSIERSNQSTTPKRRPSITERHHAHFMAAVDLWIPYVTRPPRSPYLLSIPTPRCLHNNIKLRIFPPSNTASSVASLSSLEDDTNTWDLTSDPHVTRTASRLSRSSSYNHFADDESSDSSIAGFSDGFGIQGTFPSTDRIRVRWARPIKSFDTSGPGTDARKRVGVSEAHGEMICRVKGRKRSVDADGPDGIIMEIEYKGTCKGIWFPGVATLLGLDIGLMAKNSDVAWLDGSPPSWQVTGGLGFTGFNVGETEYTGDPSINASSIDSTGSQNAISAAADKSQGIQLNGRSRHDSSSSNSSLLRASLPTQNVADYSFENLTDPAIASSSHFGTVSTMSSSSQLKPFQSPNTPLTLHVNMNEILPPMKTLFTFTITGMIVVTPRTTLSRCNGLYDNHKRYSAAELQTTEPITLPHFTVLAADTETIRITVRNEADQEGAIIEVYSASGDILNDPQTRKTVLQRGGYTRCAEDGGRMALKLIGSPRENAETKLPNSREPQLNPNELTTRVDRRVREHPRTISFVSAIITPLISRSGSFPDSYAVSVRFNAPVGLETEWLEFGLMRCIPSTSSRDRASGSSNIHVTGASLDGIPIQCEISGINEGSNSTKYRAVSFEQMNGKEWEHWMKIHVGRSRGESLVVNYVVKPQSNEKSWYPRWERARSLEILLPTFTLPVGQLEVRLDLMTDFTCIPVSSSFAHHHSHYDGFKLLSFDLPEFFSPYLSLRFLHSKSCNLSPWWSWIVNLLLCGTLLAFALSHQQMGQEIQQLRHHLQNQSTPLSLMMIDPLEQKTVTTTFMSTVTIEPPLSTPRHRFTETRGRQTPTSFMSQPPSQTSDSSPVSSSSEPSQGSLSLHVLSQTWETFRISIMEDFLEVISWPAQGYHAAQAKLQQCKGSFEKAWHMLSKVYYYPLDPP